MAYRIERIHTPDDVIKPEWEKFIVGMDKQLFPIDSVIKIEDVEGAWWWVVRDTKLKTIVGYAALNRVSARIAYLSRSGVIKSARGNGLQKRLIKVREGVAREIGCDQIQTYTAWFNVPSSNSLISCGYKLWLPETKNTGFLHWRKYL